MSSFQAITEALLFSAAASRATLQLAAPGGGFAYVAEAVTQGLLQIRHDATGGELPGAAAMRQLEQDREIIRQDDLERADPSMPRALIDRFGARAQILAPIVHNGRLAAILAVHHAPGPRQWDADALEAVGRSQAAVLAALEKRERQALDTSAEDLRDAALQATLDKLRSGRHVQRCTLRQNVSTAYAFPVTHESRAEGVRSLRGDFTIIQSGQPVIEKLLSDRAQVVQDDSCGASGDPLFHYMLKHYDDMRVNRDAAVSRGQRGCGALGTQSAGDAEMDGRGERAGALRGTDAGAPHRRHARVEREELSHQVLRTGVCRIA